MSRPAPIPPFEAPAGTLFLVEDVLLRILTDEGREVLVPLTEFFGLLVHLSLCQATALALLEPLRRFLSARGLQVPDGDHE